MGLFDAFSDKPARAAAAARTAGYNAGYGQLSDQFSQGREALGTNYTKATSLYDPLIASTTAGAGAYGDATGANGAEGLARAKESFTSTPGYTEGLNLTLNQNDARAASRGMLGSGNTIADTAKLATDYASQKYGDFVGRLQPFLGANQNAVSGEGGLWAGLGGGLNSSYDAQGQAAQATQTGIGNAGADAALAPYQASGNFWNTLLGAGTAAAKFYGAKTPSGPTMAPSPNGPNTYAPMYG